jgi:SNF2 family DNA or RNA helicase
MKFGVRKRYAGFFLAPGLGKTMIILIIFKILKKVGLIDELFVLAKRTIVYEVWPPEVKKWGLPFKVRIIHGKDKEKQLYKPADIRLMNYEGLNWLLQQKKFFRRGKRIMLAIDESSKLRHTRTKRFRTLKKMLDRFERRYILTGSPAPNGLMGLFGQIYALDQGKRLGKFITHFRNEYFQPAGFMGRDWKLQKGGRKRLYKKIKPIILRYGKDELKLPPISYFKKWVHLPPKARHIYDEMERELIVQMQEGEIIAANAAVASGKCRQIANGGLFYNQRAQKGYEHVHDAKCEMLVELLEELQGEPALVSYEFKHDIPRIQNYLRRHAPQFKKAPFVGGHTKPAELRKLKRDWNAGKIPVMFGQPDTVAHGLNLQESGGAVVIFFALTWNLENYEQFIQRIWRQGVKKRVLVYHIMAKNTVDEVMWHALRRKDRGQQSLLRAMERDYEIEYKKAA